MGSEGAKVKLSLKDKLYAFAFLLNLSNAQQQDLPVSDFWLGISRTNTLGICFLLVGTWVFFPCFDAEVGYHYGGLLPCTAVHEIWHDRR